MKVKELQKVLENLDPDFEVVVAAFDHSYRPIDDAYPIKAALSGSEEYYEYYGKKHLLDKHDKVVKVVVIE